LLVLRSNRLFESVESVDGCFKSGLEKILATLRDSEN
jgi:hypothetical protein